MLITLLLVVIEVAPVYELLPLSTSVPFPGFVTVAVPAIAVATVLVPPVDESVTLVLTVSVPPVNENPLPVNDTDASESTGTLMIDLLLPALKITVSLVAGIPVPPQPDQFPLVVQE